jgi:hypothetical protein
MSRSSKRKRVPEESEFEPDAKKKKIDANTKPVETYSTDDITGVHQDTDKQVSVDIDHGFTKSTTDSQNIAKPPRGKAKAISKLGNHVLAAEPAENEPEISGIKKEEKEELEKNEEVQAGSSALSTKAQNIIKSLPNIGTLPKLVVPEPLPGKFSDLNRPGLSTVGTILCVMAQLWDLNEVGRALMNEDCPATTVNIVFSETAKSDDETFIAGVAHSRVTELGLMGGNFTSRSVAGDPLSHAAQFGSMLVTSTVLHKLSFLNIRPVAFDSFYAGLNACASLETLILCQSDVNDDGLQTLVSVLCNPNSKLKLKHLNLTGNTFTSASAEWIQYLLENHKTLEAICFSDNEGMKEEFGTYLGKGLAKNNTLKRIHFYKSKLGAKGSAAMLKEMTGVNNTLELLNFEMCKIGKLGGDALIDFIQKNDSLLHLGSSGIAEKTWPKLLKVMESKDNLLKFDINKPDERVGDLDVLKLIAESPRLTEMRGSHYNLLCGEEVVLY